VGTIQATEAIKLLLGIGRPLIGELLLIDALEAGFRRIKVRKDPACPACGTREITKLVEEQLVCEAPSAAAFLEIAPVELKARLDRGDPLFLLDVREPHEWAIARLDGAALIPLGEVSRSLEQIPHDREIVVYCKGGARSAKAAEQLVAAGYGPVSNLIGGITRWSLDVDPSVPRY